MAMRFLNIDTEILYLLIELLYCKSESAPIKRTVQEAREHNALLDATYGRKQGRLLLWMMGMLY